MNAPSEFDMQASPQTTSPLQTVLSTSLARESQDIIRHLGRVLDLRKDERVLLIPGDGAFAALTLVNTYGCDVTVLNNVAGEELVQPSDERIHFNVGALDSLPFEAGYFDAVLVAVPVTTRLQRVARELARVLKRSGRLGMVALSVYRDQVADEAGAVVVQQSQGHGQIRPAAAYRAVLGEAGFTAFLHEDRRRELRRSAQEIYRQHMIEPEPATSSNATLRLLAAGGVSMTLITAEKGV
jgi:SAM-dependent methyltransferase